jgi:hypothetical protein
MKEYAILHTFLGNQTGYGDTETFTAGTTARLSDALAAVAVAEGWAAPAGTPEARETKVITDMETKPAKPLSKMSKAELVAYGMERGIELTPDSMTIKDMLVVLEA